MWLSKTKVLSFVVGLIVISFLQYSYFNYRVGNEHRTLSEAVDILTFKFSETIAYEDLYEENKDKAIGENISLRVSCNRILLLNKCDIRRDVQIATIQQRIEALQAEIFLDGYMKETVGRSISLYKESILKIKQKKINELIESEQKSWEEGREERLEKKVDELLLRIDSLEKEQNHDGK
ncbi:MULTISPECIES: hypothetical protein [unclassified Vibrio]|uniref:hypothetical protein n=1 Tax=unclassified Vibrio TaxID=2614977 RepID=UPI000C8481A7|nr:MULTISPECIES: hypothetical protein [unclassified Vibrio]PMK74893.1 hypothetical protein BCT92_23905 [Vibrio sp. 10N.261.52.E5]TKF76173.1 hypothetical protein FCV65_24755 [Vibrio sp. F13]